MTSGTQPARPKLRLIVSSAFESHVRGDVKDSKAFGQQSLFPTGIDALAVFVAVDELKAGEFLRILDGLRPTAVTDMRKLPLFDLGQLTRSRVFSEFDRRRIRYRDLSSFVRHLEPSDEDKLSTELSRAILVDLDIRELYKGPILFLVNSDIAKSGVPYRFLQALGDREGRGWDLSFFPALPSKEQIHSQAVRTAEVVRDIVFISHANPEDNEFATWLYSRLVRLGYKVWYDVGSLRAGDTFWDEIEDTIRNRTARFIAVLSKAAQVKQGCLDEINLAINVERGTGVRNFVLPVRIDDLPFAEVRANLARKNIADFSNSWAHGLAQLINSFERDRVPRKPEAGPSQLLEVWRAQRSLSTPVVREPESLLTNWLPIVSLPSAVYLYHGEVSPQVAEEPLIAYEDTVLSFVPFETSTTFRRRGAVATDDFLRGNPSGFLRLPPPIAQNAITHLVRQMWNQTMAARGLTRYELSGRRVCWYFPENTPPSAFIDAEGARRRRSLWGISERRRVKWHFAVEANPVLSNPQRLTLLEHVCFTREDGSLVDAKVGHRLRRSFCKNWWNDRWRDLLIGGLVTISRGQPTIVLGETSNPLVVDAKPARLISPLSIHEAANDSQITEAEDDTPEDLDEDELALDDFETTEVGG